MLDKDFDAFFKSSFEDFEVAPATDSWSKISEKINTKPRKQKFPLFWTAAASILIVLGVGIGLLNKPSEVIKLRPDGETEMMENLAQEQKPIISTVDEQPVKKNIEKQISKIRATEKLAVTDNIASDINTNEIEVADERVTSELKTVKNIKQVRSKLITERLLEEQDIAPLKKEVAVTLLENEGTFIASVASNKNNPGRKLTISSVGDLVNFVVAKVDKRDEKIIKMTKTEESDNEITGINLGLFKFRKLD